MENRDSSKEITTTSKKTKISKKSPKASQSTLDAQTDIPLDDILSPTRSQITFAAADYISLLHTSQLIDRTIVGKLITQVVAEYTSKEYNTILEHMPNQDLQFHMTGLLAAAIPSDTFEPNINESEREKLYFRAAKAELSVNDWAQGDPANILVPVLQWNIKGSSRAPSSPEAFLIMMRTNRNPFSFAEQRANWMQGIQDLKHVSTAWALILKQVIAELDKLKRPQEPLHPIWKLFAEHWGMEDHSKATKRIADTSQLSQAFARAVSLTQAAVSSSKESGFMDTSLFEAYKLPNPKKSAEKHADGTLDKAKGKKRKSSDTTSPTSTPPRSACRSCGNSHKGDCAAFKLQHPDVNKEDKAWKESTMGKLYQSLNRFTLRINSRLNPKRDGFVSKEIYTRPGKPDTFVFTIDTPETHLPSPYIKAKAVTPDGATVSIDKVLLDTGSLKSNFISTELYNSLTPIFGLGIPTKHCACSAFIGVCQSNLIKFTFTIDIFNESSNSTYTLTLHTYVIDSPVPLIIGRPDIIKHQLFVKIPSQLYLGTDASRVLCDHRTRPATEEEYCVLIKERQELLDAENYGLSEEMVGDEPAQPWDEEPVSDIPTEIHGSDTLKAGIRTILEEYRDVFSRVLPSKPADVTPMRINIITQKHQECKMQRHARIQSATKNAEILRQVQKMIANNLIAPSQAYKFSQVLLAPKKNNTWRFCIDYRRVNDCTEPSGWPIPIIDEMIQRLGRSGA
jgi:hypothetical protein